MDGIVAEAAVVLSAVERTSHGMTEDQVADVVAIADAAERNDHITRGYHDLALAMAGLIGAENLSWSAFAAWSSRTVGRFIRGEGVPPLLLAAAERVDRALFGRALSGRARSGARSPLAALRRGSSERGRSVFVTAFIERVKAEIARQLGGGNQMVFADIGRLFSRMVASFRGTTGYDQAAVDRATAHLRPGALERGGEDLLIAAVTHYHRAMFEADRKKRAELVLLANNQIGKHEQTRLQPWIERALNAPLSTVEAILRGAVRDTIERSGGSLRGRLMNRARRAVARVVGPAARWLRRVWPALATRWLMTLDLCRHSLSLAEDLPGHCEHQMFPAELRHIDHPELAALLDELDLTPHTTAGSAAHNWADLSHRMNYIVDLFRSRQKDFSLYRDPSAPGRAGACHAVCHAA